MHLSSLIPLSASMHYSLFCALSIKRVGEERRPVKVCEPKYETP